MDDKQRKELRENVWKILAIASQRPMLESDTNKIIALFEPVLAEKDKELKVLRLAQKCWYDHRCKLESEIERVKEWAKTKGVTIDERCGIDLIREERDKHDEKGWTVSHDAKHSDGELANMAAYYAASKGWKGAPLYPSHWCGWARQEKYTRMKQLAVAGALIAAEIDRLRRKAQSKGEALTIQENIA